MARSSLTPWNAGSSMLGQFLEYSVAARPLAASFEFFESLGFASIPVSDTLPDPYVVCFDGTVAVGLHDRPQAGPRLTFVRPGLRDYVRPLRRLGVEITDAHLRDNEFNSIGFSDPGGQEAAHAVAKYGRTAGDRATHGPNRLRAADGEEEDLVVIHQLRGGDAQCAGGRIGMRIGEEGAP